MRDWKKEVRDRLSSLNLPADDKEDVIAELAGHLEDSEFDNHAPKPVPAATLDQIHWRRLARSIRDAKREERIMNPRTKVLWLPAMANLTLYTGLLFLCAFLREVHAFEPRLSPASHSPLPMFHPWLAILPFCGAAGALLAKRAEASMGTRLLAGLAPSLIWLAVFSIMGIVLVCDPGHFRGFPVSELALAAFGWIVVPGLLLSVGTVPFLKTADLQS